MLGRSKTTAKWQKQAEATRSLFNAKSQRLQRPQRGETSRADAWQVGGGRGNLRRHLGLHVGELLCAWLWLVWSSLLYRLRDCLRRGAKSRFTSGRAWRAAGLM